MPAVFWLTYRLVPGSFREVSIFSFSWTVVRASYAWKRLKIGKRRFQILVGRNFVVPFIYFYQDLLQWEIEQQMTLKNLGSARKKIGGRTARKMSFREYSLVRSWINLQQGNHFRSGKAVDLHQLLSKHITHRRRGWFLCQLHKIQPRPSTHRATSTRPSIREAHMNIQLKINKRNTRNCSVPVTDQTASTLQVTNKIVISFRFRRNDSLSCINLLSRKWKTSRNSTRRNAAQRSSNIRRRLFKFIAITCGKRFSRWTTNRYKPWL